MYKLIKITLLTLVLLMPTKSMAYELLVSIAPQTGVIQSKPEHGEQDAYFFTTMINVSDYTGYDCGPLADYDYPYIAFDYIPINSSGDIIGNWGDRITMVNGQTAFWLIKYSKTTYGVSYGNQHSRHSVPAQVSNYTKSTQCTSSNNGDKHSELTLTDSQISLGSTGVEPIIGDSDKTVGGVYGELDIGLSYTGDQSDRIHVTGTSLATSSHIYGTVYNSPETTHSEADIIVEFRTADDLDGSLFYNVGCVLETGTSDKCQYPNLAAGIIPTLSIGEYFDTLDKSEMPVLGKGESLKFRIWLWKSQTANYAESMAMLDNTLKICAVANKSYMDVLTVKYDHHSRTANACTSIRAYTIDDIP